MDGPETGCRFLLDREGIFEEVSESFAQLLGHTPAELVGKAIDDVTASGTTSIPQQLGLVASLGRFEGLWMFVRRDEHAVVLCVEWELLPGLSFLVRCRQLPPVIRRSKRRDLWRRKRPISGI